MVRPVGDDLVLRVSGLVTHFFLSGGVVRAVDGIDLDIRREEIVTIVGESGSGKSVTALSIMRLISKPGRILSGEVMHLGKDLLKLSQREMQSVRGTTMSMVFQNPLSSLHPVMTIGHQMIESITLRESIDKRHARRRAIELLEQIGVTEPERVLEHYPFEVSAGVCQRVMLAIALASRPALLIADEPTTNLDALSQVQFLQLVKSMRSELRMSVLLITHDFGVVSMMSDKIVVMYAGKQVESGDASKLLHCPAHPYSTALLNSVRVLDQGGKLKRLEQIPGEVPDVMRLPPGCSFRPRCTRAMDVCHQAPPNLTLAGRHRVSCWLHEVR